MYICATRLKSATDSCKFLHDRSDYKSGWQLDREFEENQYGNSGISTCDEWVTYAVTVCCCIRSRAI